MIKLTNRLMAIASEVNACDTVIDIGTDHGYLPVYLVQKNICKKAIACDVNLAPLNSCKFLVNSLSLQDSIKCVLSDGFDDIEDSFNTVIIAGMGGELISNILSRGDIEELKACSFIFNPMTHSELVRNWLYENGFTIDNDIILPDLNHHYNIISAHYTAQYVKPDIVKCFLGEIKDYSDAEYFLHLKNYLVNKEKSGYDFSQVIKAIEERI